MGTFRILKVSILAIILGISLPLFAQNVNTTNAYERYKDKKFYIADISEMSIEGSIAIAVTFSTPIAEGQNLDKIITVHNGAKQADGSWEVSKNRQEIYFKYLEPDTTYSVYVQEPAKIKNISGKGYTVQADILSI
ncbi:MAG: hypothetical protein LBF13_00985 [Campylobacteraceae bacterium]|nr:hypothetical protein [Campylobacteraceae bacterium]